MRPDALPDTPVDPRSGPRADRVLTTLVGTLLGNSYEVTRLLGRGGMGAVYEARHVRLPRRAALKVMQPEIASDRTAFERFKREAEIASSLGNRHIVQVFDFDYLPDGSPHLLMEFLEGEDLAHAIAHRAPFRPQHTAHILEQAVSALTAAHGRGIVHRDIKPANMFLARESDGAEVLKLLDFGLCKARTGTKSLTHENIVGTPLYMSPEQLR